MLPDITLPVPVQVLKVIRYTSKLVLVTSLADSKSGAAKGLKRFEASVGTSRCELGWRSMLQHRLTRSAAGLLPCTTGLMRGPLTPDRD